MVIASVGPSAYWYLTRGTGIVALVLLTLSVALGVANVRRLRTELVPRFVFDSIHRTVSLLAVAFTAVHIVTSLLDGFAPIRLIDAIVPFTAPYRPLWLGFGAVAFDLLIAVALTSVFRRRFGYRTWRLTHWGAYASWPVALLHGVGTGSDVRLGWALAIIAGCVIIVIVAVVARVTAGWPKHLGARLSGLGVAALMPIGLLVWLPSGPLAPGWARRAGTPSNLLVSTNSTSSISSPTSAGGGKASSRSAGTGQPASFTTTVSGTVRQGQSGGLAIVDISLTVSGRQLSQLHVQISGQPLDGGGVQMTSSRVTLGTPAAPSQFSGHITSLEGTNIQAELIDATGASITLVAQLQLNAESGNASGTVTISPRAGASG